MRGVAQQTLQREAWALTKLATDDHLIAELEELARFIASRTRRGHRVITVGVGKSGHAAEKLATTLTSVGVPSHFIHATEAAHGGLGAIRSDDVVIFVSASGTTTELEPVLNYAIRHDAVTAAIVGESGIFAGRADFVLRTKHTSWNEAYERIPTSSFLTATAVGDALVAVTATLIEVSAADLRAAHPGGFLGATRG